ncbi:MAG: Vacuole effluxer Atg22 like protein [Acidobacteria bacterium OLB17]|nr:MAG: Vacuole effluxer Atg22 like protein [Acidobacteria bacterium OLB17]MCZ2392136.1 MFS transporter [Acidobacteriota bacterium]
MTKSTLDKNRPLEIFGWVMYDWANHAFFAVVLGVLVGPYLTELAQRGVGENGAVIAIGGYVLVSAKSLFSYSVGLSVFLQVFFLPVLGAIADYTHLKKAFMAAFCYLGAFGCVLLYFAQGDLYLFGSVAFILANLSAGASIVFFNSFLNDISTEDRRDRVSSWSFAVGYAGATTTLILSFLLLLNAERLGISTEYAVRICLLASGLWWGGFAVISFCLLRSRQPVRTPPEGKSIVSAGLREVVDTFKELFRLKHTLKFLIAYLIYNDGIQTVITMAGVFITQELFVAKGLPDDRTVLVIAILIAQIVAIFGALILEFVSRLTSTKTAILISLAVWAAIVVYGYFSLETIGEAYFMSAAIGFVLGGSQALSRSLFSRMIPSGREAAFFGIYAISERGTSWLGPIAFGLVAQLTNSYRPAILALIVFFVAGGLLLFFTDTKRAIHEAGNLTSAEAATQ